MLRQNMLKVKKQSWLSAPERNDAASCLGLSGHLFKFAVMKSCVLILLAVSTCTEAAVSPPAESARYKN